MYGQQQRNPGLEFIASLLGGGLQGFQHQQEFNYERHRQQQLDAQNAEERNQRRQLLGLQIDQTRQAPELAQRKEEADSVGSLVPMFPTAAPRLLGARADILTGRKHLPDFTTGDMNLPSGIGYAGTVPHHVAAKTGLEALTFGQPSAMDLASKSEAENRAYTEGRDERKSTREHGFQLGLEGMKLDQAFLMNRLNHGDNAAGAYFQTLSDLEKNTNLSGADLHAEAVRRVRAAFPDFTPTGDATPDLQVRGAAPPAPTVAPPSFDLQGAQGKRTGISPFGDAQPAAPIFDSPALSAPSMPPPPTASVTPAFRTTGQLQFDKAANDKATKDRTYDLEQRKAANTFEVGRRNANASERRVGIYGRSVDNQNTLGAQRNALEADRNTIAGQRAFQATQPKPVDPNKMNEADKTRSHELEVSIREQEHAYNQEAAHDPKSPRLNQIWKGIQDYKTERDGIYSRYQPKAAPSQQGPPHNFGISRDDYVRQLKTLGASPVEIQTAVKKRYGN